MKSVVSRSLRVSFAADAEFATLQLLSTRPRPSGRRNKMYYYKLPITPPVTENFLRALLDSVLAWLLMIDTAFWLPGEGGEILAISAISQLPSPWRLSGLMTSVSRLNSISDHASCLLLLPTLSGDLHLLDLN